MKILLLHLDLLFEGQQFIIFISLKRSKLAQKCLEVFCQILHLQSNGVVAKIALRDRDLLFEYNKLNFYISETVKASTKMFGKHL